MNYNQRRRNSDSILYLMMKNLELSDIDLTAEVPAEIVELPKM